MDQYINTIINIIAAISVIDTAILMIAIIYAIFLWVNGISPALYRLGNGLAKRKIAIFSKGDNLNSLRSLLLDSNLFKKKNIIEITSKNDLGKAEEASVYLVYWHDWESDIEEILNKKPDKYAMIVYAPYDKERISIDQMKNLDGKRHTAVTNFRGRLLNDLVTAMITTSYK